MMRSMPILFVVLAVIATVIAVGITAVFAQDGGMTWKPQIATAVFIPKDASQPMFARPLGEIDLGYLLPWSPTGEHNIKIAGIGGGSPGDEGFGNAGFKLGYAYAPKIPENIVFGLVGVFDAVYPTDALAVKIGAENETWLTYGFEGSLDFKAAGIPGALMIGYTRGAATAPDRFWFAFGINMQTVAPEETVKRVR